MSYPARTEVLVNMVVSFFSLFFLQFRTCPVRLNWVVREIRSKRLQRFFYVVLLPGFIQNNMHQCCIGLFFKLFGFFKLWSVTIKFWANVHHAFAVETCFYDSWIYNCYTESFLFSFQVRLEWCCSGLKIDSAMDWKFYPKQHHSIITWNEHQSKPWW